MLYLCVFGDISFLSLLHASDPNIYLMQIVSSASFAMHRLRYAHI